VARPIRWKSFLTTHQVPEALQKRPMNTASVPNKRSNFASEDEFPTIEVDWFLINCYNVAVRAASVWPSPAVIGLFRIVIQVSELETVR
jgi:hypothetical protein